MYAPIFALVLFSFNDSKSMARWNGFTWKWYGQLLQNESIMSALYYTIVIAILASVISTIVGTISAIGIHKMRGKSKKLILNVNYLPILNTEIVTAVALMSLFVFVKMEFGFTTMLLAHIMFCLPYVILSVLPKMKQLPDNIEDAAMDLGATPIYALRKVILPQIKPGIVSGFLIAFTMSIDDFIISFFNAGNGVSNLSIEIYGMARRGIKPEINALSTIMFAVVLGLLLLANKKESIVRGIK
ncbi:ABC transporter spermidine/putrescine permease [Clostridioides difficile]|uniref:ABC-type transport system,spermidine/putrescine permease n=7 Tax=Clostridioides difficile TaxID=1496 RepID=Q18AM6_CLOD6|nr:ABC transporter permease [Clostridioides difficile]AJP10712.1 ABC-type transport system, spermidine / putrescine permease [Clostridioides difficile 630]AKP42001.1 spermidine/putrescine ABC transporter permease [Clostridioides difficile ATCC 9689 = DSM 1296]EQE11599.1 binding--dependent transport system inner membrane component family protein [Clostridioides difficile CD13]EQE14212.1 binding--dependent transport system inner membrane component family protein [Clostridioides difficile CD8]EQE